MTYYGNPPIPVAAPSKAWVCSRSLAGTAGSNPAGRMNVCLLCYQVEVSAFGWSLVQRSPTECGVCLSVIVKPQQWGGPGPLGAVAPGWGGGWIRKLRKSKKHSYVCKFLWNGGTCLSTYTTSEPWGSSQNIRSQCRDSKTDTCRILNTSLNRHVRELFNPLKTERICFI
jgi:hypothetical protein